MLKRRDSLKSADNDLIKDSKQTIHHNLILFDLITPNGIPNRKLFDYSHISPGTVMSILYIGHTDGGIADSVVDHSVHRHSHAVLGQHLQIAQSVQTIQISVSC